MFLTKEIKPYIFYLRLYSIVEHKPILLNPPPHNVVFASPISKPNNFSHSTYLPRQRKIETVKGLPVKIKSIDIFAILSKFHLNNRVYIFRSIHEC